MKNRKTYNLQLTTYNSKKGFTLVELTIVIVMMGLLLSVVVVNLRDNQHRIAASTSAELAASSLRTMQNNSLSGLRKPSGDPATNYGWSVSTVVPNQYRTYADLTLVSQEQLNTENFVPGVEFRNPVIDGDAVVNFNVTFSLPYGEIILNGDSDLNLGVIEVVHVSSGYGKRVIIKANTGDIEIRDL